jgi:hypothetical protein
MVREPLAGHGAEALDNLQHAGREAHLLGELAQPDRGQRREFRGLEEHGATCSQSRRQLGWS